MASRIGRIARRLAGLARPIDDLAVDPANLRVHNRRSLDAIAASLKRFGQQKPIVVDAHGVSVAGAGVIAAARLLGWTHVAALRSDLQPVERIAYAIADNRTAELSEWDTPALLRTLRELPAGAVEAAGFTPEDLEQLGLADAASMADDAAPTPLPVAVANRGELWRLGKHRLLCGDSTDAGDVRKLLGKRKAALVATDPPYLVDYTGERPEAKGDNGGGKDWSGLYREIDIDDAERFFRLTFENALAVLAPHAPLYCWHAHRRVGLIQKIFAELEILDHQQIVWVKPTSVLGRCFWHFQHEPCIMGWRKGSKPRHNGVHVASSVWVVPWARGLEVQGAEAADVWFADWEGKARVVGNEHPTQKPLELFARPMRKHTKVGDLVYEPFSGSGSQLVAAEQLERVCYAMELQPVFVDVAIRRWQTLTGDDAVLEGTKSTWTELSRRRGIIPGDPRGQSPKRPAKTVPAQASIAPCPDSPPSPAPSPDARPSPRSGTARRTPKRTPGRARPRRARPAATAPRGSVSGG